jgi:hypothetical protein|tara:strand:- start:736 stop:879 length:144 start_codon:yes stop_codon:yes gene_type:complete
MKLKKFSHRGGIVGRRTRALERLEKIVEPTELQQNQIVILKKKLQVK